MKTRFLHWFAGCLVGLMIAAPIAASAAGTGAGGTQEAVHMLKSTAQDVMNSIRSHHSEYKQNPQKLYDLVDKEILPHFDATYMSRLVLGYEWRNASAQQRQVFTKTFTQLLVHTYSNSLLEYSNANLHWKPVHAPANADNITVRSELTGANTGSPVPIDYRVHKTNGKWEVYDVSVDGISLVTNYRSSYTSIAREHGMDYLIKALKKKLHHKESSQS